MDSKCVAVFTAVSPDRILQEGGSQAWALDPARARKAPFLVCAQNQNHPDRDFSDASEPHGAVFLIGKISDVIPASEAPDRWQIRISEFCRVTVRDAWKGWRNPVRYTTLEAMGINPTDLRFQPVGDTQPVEPAAMTASPGRAAHNGAAAPISIAAAKIGLAAFYGVAPGAVEIVIRG